MALELSQKRLESLTQPDGSPHIVGKRLESLPVESSGSSFTNVLKQIPGGAVDAFVEAGETIKSIGDYIRDQVPFIEEIDPGTQFQIPIPETEDPQSGTASLVRGATQFITAFVPFFRATKFLGASRAGVRGATAGVATDLTAFDPDDPLFADMIEALDPRLKNPITDFLGSDPDDTDAEKRLKRAVEGLGLGMLGEGVVRGVRALRASKQLRGGVLPEQPLAGEEIATQTISRVPRQLQPADDLILPTTREVIEETELPKFAGSINIERLQTDEGVKQSILEASEKIPKNQPVTHQSTIEAAARLGYTVEDVGVLERATTKQRSQFLASRNVFVGVSENYETARLAFIDNSTPETFQALKNAEIAHLRTFREMQSIASNAGFSLQSFRIGAKADISTQVEKGLLNAISDLQSKGRLTDELTARLASLDKTNLVEVNVFLNELSVKGARGSDKLFEAFINSILSGPQTHAANIIGNLGNAVLRPFERLSSATAELFIAPVRKRGRERFFGEAVVDVYGMFAGFPDAVHAFARTARTGMMTYGGKLEVGSRRPAIEGIKGTVTRVPTRVLLATDEFFKALSRRGALYAEAYRSGVKKGLKGQNLQDDMMATMAAPSEELLKRLDTEAAYRTFTKELGASGKKVIAFRGIPGMRYIIPFITTPINIAKFGLERTPLKAFDIIRMAAKGELKQAGQLSEEIGKLAIGLGLMTWVATEVSTGNITGSGPADPAQRRALMLTGWKPQSFKIGNEYVSYSRIEPFATSIGILADAAEIFQAGMEAGVIDDKVAADLMDKLAQATVNNLTNKTFLIGLQDLSNAMQDPGRYGRQFVNRRAGAIVPSLIGQAARAQDPLLRDVQTTLDTIKSKLPAIGDFSGRQGLFPIRDLFGKAIDQPGNFWYRYMIPLRRSEISGEPAAFIISELEVEVGKLPKRITIKNKDIDLTGAQYDEYQKMAGREVERLVASIVPALGSLSKEQKKIRIRGMIRKGRDTGRAKMIEVLQDKVKELL